MMKVGDKVLLKLHSPLRATFGEAASAVGIVSGVVDQSITVDYPDIPYFSRLLPASDFSEYLDASHDPMQVDRWQQLVDLVDVGAKAEPAAVQTFQGDQSTSTSVAVPFYRIFGAVPAELGAPQQAFGKMPNGAKRS